MNILYIVFFLNKSIKPIVTLIIQLAVTPAKDHFDVATSIPLNMIPGLAKYFRFSFRFFKKGSCQLLAKVCARSTG